MSGLPSAILSDSRRIMLTRGLSPCAYATTSLSSPIVEKYNKITKDSIQPDDSESVYE